MMKTQTPQAVIPTSKKLVGIFALAALVTVTITNHAIADPVTLENPSAITSQSFGSFGSIAEATDGIFGGNPLNGWGGEAFTPEITPANAAVWETATDLDAGTFTFTMTYDLSDHEQGNFRWSATTANRSQFADGMANGGQIGDPSIWTVLTATSIISDAHTYSILPSGAMLVDDPVNRFLTDVITVEAFTGLSGITGLRLEALNDGPAGRPGPGIRPTFDDSNFVLTEVAVDHESSFFIPDISIFWADNVSGDWNEASNWTGNTRPPVTFNHSAVFGDAIQSAQTVFTNTDVTVNDVQFDNSNRYIVAGAGSIHLTTGTFQNLPTTGVSVAQGSHKFQAMVELNNDATVDVASGSTLEFVNRLHLNGNTLTKTGVGALVISNTLNTGNGTLNVDEGTIIGSGTIGGDVTNDGGTISPGDAGLLGDGASAVPEPAGLALLLLGIIAWFARRRPTRT